MIGAARGLGAVLGRLPVLARRDTSLLLASAVGIQIARIASTIALTRMLDAETFGVIGILASINYIVVMLSDLGFFAFVVRHARGTEPAFLDEVWTLRLIRSALLMIAVALFAGPIAGYLGKPQLVAAIVATGAMLFVEGLSSMAFATAARSRQIGRLALLDLLPALVQIVASIAIAAVIRNYWALVIAMTIGGLSRSLLSYWLFPGSRRRWALSGERMRELLGFGRFIAASSYITLLLAQTDKVVLARLFTLDAFGLYSIAATLAFAPAAFISSYVQRILFPAFAKVYREAPAMAAQVYYETGRPMRLLYMIAAGGFSACAPLLITLLYDPRYAAAASYLQILALAEIARLPVAAATEMLIAGGETRQTLRINLVRVACLAVFGIAGFALYGPIGIVCAIVAMEFGALAYSWWALHHHGILRPMRELPGIGAVALGFAIGTAVNTIGLRFIH